MIANSFVWTENGRLVMADGFRKHASALGMTKEAFKKHLASIADKIKRESMDDED